MKQKQVNEVRTAEEQAKSNLIVKHLAGSRSYGTSTPESDVDYRGVFVADEINVRTPFWNVGEVAIADEEDTKLYELSKFVKLVAACNPNVIETLWVDEQFITYQHPCYKLLREAAPKMLTTQIAVTTSGFAFSEMKKIRADYTNGKELDGKNALHFVRLLRMGNEALTEGVVRVNRPDAEELLSIRNGAWDYDQLFSYGLMMDEKLRLAREKSPLPKSVDMLFVAKLILDIQDIMWEY